MPSMDEALNQFLGQVNRIAKMPQKQQAQITQAGAKVFAGKLKNQTEAMHPNTKGSGGKLGHLSNQVTYNDKNIDGGLDGTSTVGFAKKAFVARFLNDGTKFVQGDHFVDDARKDATNEILAAEAAEYKRIIAKGEDE